MPQQVVVHREVEGTAKRKPFQDFGSRLPLCLLARVIAWPLVFSIVATAQGIGCATPTPSDIASGMGESMCAASYSRAIDLSRITAQPAVRTTSTASPWRW
jgi:hypothetical protein